jgi:hypothetical protein
MWCVVVCDLENLKNEEAMTRVGSQRHKKWSPVSDHEGPDSNQGCGSGQSNNEGS